MKNSTVKNCMTAISISFLLATAACHNIGSPSDPINSLAGDYRETEIRLNTYAQNAVKEGQLSEALKIYQTLYERSLAMPGKPETNIVLNYAQLLRKNGNVKKSLEVLSPFLENTRGKLHRKIDYVLANEFAAGLIEDNNLEKADLVLNRVLEDSQAKEFHADAFNLRGILLNNKEQYKDAETSFRQALVTWKGDNTSVKNNLAICLASQGLFDESLFTLRQALIEAPNKEAIAYNIKLISELRGTIIPKASTPLNIKP